MSNSVSKLRSELKAQADPVKAKFFPRFFKAGPGGYAEGDKFLGVTVPKQRIIAKNFYNQLSLAETIELLKGEWHEERLVALFILVLQFQKGDQATKKQILDLYLSNTKWVNNWDLVDSSAYQIIGGAITNKINGRQIYYELAKSENMWERRMAIVGTMALIRLGDLADTYKIAEILLNDKHDLIHKAVGWLLREAGKKDEASLRQFLDKHALHMPRTTLRYAIERFDPATREDYLGPKSKA